MHHFFNVTEGAKNCNFRKNVFSQDVSQACIRISPNWPFSLNLYQPWLNTAWLYRKQPQWIPFVAFSRISMQKCRIESKASALEYQDHVSLLTLSWRRPISYKNQSIDLRSKSMDWFLYDNGLCHKRIK